MGIGKEGTGTHLATGRHLQAERVFLRRFLVEDVGDLYEYLSDPEVVKYEPYEPFSRADAGQEAARRAGDENFWAVCLKGSGKAIGNVYFAKQEFGTWELGYVFHRGYQGQGYATEAAERVITEGFRHWGVRRVTAMCNPENERSWRLLERLGMRREGHLRQNISFRTDGSGNPVWQDTYEYAVLVQEWNERNSL